MKYRPDKDLEFLKQIESRKLNYLGSILLYDYVGKSRTTAFDESFELLHVDEDKRDVKNWQIFATEIQYFGGNTLVNRVRRNGVCYEEIVDDVADKMELSDFLKNKSVEEKENVIVDQLRRYISTLLETNVDDMSVDVLQYCLREYCDSSAAMERLLQDSAKERKHLLKKIGNKFLDSVYPELKVLNMNWSVVVQTIVEISLLRKSENGLSIAIIGNQGSGKTTLLKYLQEGSFVPIDKGTSIEEKFDSFKSPIFNMKIESGSDVAGGRDYRELQISQCKNKDLIFFCFNPLQVIESEEHKNDFIIRLGTIKDISSDKLVFIATFADKYEQNKSDVKEALYKMMHSDDMGTLSKKFKVENCKFVSLKNETQTKQMFDEIKESYL